MDGIIVLDKPLGKTSHDMVYFVRRLTGIKKVGHTGTLDPQATGVLPVCIGKATKAADMLTFSDKKYRAELIFGMTTDTQDAEGEVLSECPFVSTKEQVEKVIASFIGDIKQIPPMYSAIKIDGKKLYELAREGLEVKRKERNVTIYSIDIVSLDMEEGRAVIDVHCSKGTYIRTLCEDIGIALGCGAYMNTLRRTQSSIFTLDDSYTQSELLAIKEKNGLDEVLISLDTIFSHLEKLVVNDKQTQRVKDGVRISAAGIVDGHQYRIYDNNDNFLCVSTASNGRLVLDKSFW